MENTTSCLWFNTQSEAAVKFYISFFKNSKIIKISSYEEKGADTSGEKEGSVLTVLFRLAGREVPALNGDSALKYSGAVSLIVNCKTQKELDEFWEKLSEGGEEGQCGWLKDKFGFSWQIVPAVLTEMLQDRNPEKAERVMEAMIKMKKIDIETLKQAYLLQ